MDSAMLWFSWASNFFPWQVWAAGFVVIAIVVAIYWAPIWLMLPTWLKISLIFTGVVIVVYVAGRNKGSKDERDMQKEREAGATQLREKVDATIQKLDGAAVQKRLDRWRRD